jgi:hypothetical protein
MIPCNSEKQARHHLVLAVVSLLGIACGVSTGPEDRGADFSGVVLELESHTAPQYDFAFRIARMGGDTAIVRIGHATRVYETAPDGGLRTTDAQALMVGDTVDVWTTGGEFRSLPPQYDGTQVVIR